jgi:hypothetical protein
MASLKTMKLDLNRPVSQPVRFDAHARTITDEPIAWLISRPIKQGYLSEQNFRNTKTVRLERIRILCCLDDRCACLHPQRFTPNGLRQGRYISDSNCRGREEIDLGDFAVRDQARRST